MNNNQKRLPLAETLDGFLAGEPAYFCVPGHRFERGISSELTTRFGEGVFRYDLTEANGLDDLHAARGAIKEAQELAAQLYGADKSYFLVNGTSCGNEAMLLACLKENEEVILARNAHQSVISGLILSGAKPVWIMPEYESEWGFYAQVEPEKIEKAFMENPKAKAVMITSPTYYGVVSDIEAIAEICHKRGVPLLVDEAHGSHLYFYDGLPKGALAQGADGVVMSSHKTIGAMTQSSMLHIKGERISRQRLEGALRMLMSSSPSYVLMTALDAARQQMALEGEALLKRALDLSLQLRRGLEEIDGVSVFGGSNPGELLKNKIDATRVCFSARQTGLSGFTLFEKMYESGRVSFEMADSENLLAVITAANTKEDIERLLDTLQLVLLKEKGKKDESLQQSRRLKNLWQECGSEKILSKKSPRNAFFAEKEEIPLKKSMGRVCCQSIAPYPPGIPVINPGEVIGRETMDILELCLKGELPIHSYGNDDLHDIEVIKE